MFNNRGILTAYLIQIWDDYAQREFAFDFFFAFS